MAIRVLALGAWGRQFQLLEDLSGFFSGNGQSAEHRDTLGFDTRGLRALKGRHASTTSAVRHQSVTSYRAWNLASVRSRALRWAISLRPVGAASQGCQARPNDNAMLAFIALEAGSNSIRNRIT